MRIIDLLKNMFRHPGVAGLLAALSVLLGGAGAADAGQQVPRPPQHASVTVPADAPANHADGHAVTNDIVYPLGDVNLRAEPSTSAAVLAVLPQGHAVLRVSIGDSGWSKISANGIEGYVSNGLLAEIPPPAAAPEPVPDEPAETELPEATPTLGGTPQPTAAPAMPTEPLPQSTEAPIIEDGYLHASYGAELMRLINAYRAENGLPALASSETKQADTDYAAREISVNGFAHTGRDNNIAMGYGSPEATLQAWIGSAPHRANLLFASAATGAASCYVDSSGVMWWAFRY